MKQETDEKEDTTKISYRVTCTGILFGLVATIATVGVYVVILLVPREPMPLLPPSPPRLPLSTTDTWLILTGAPVV